jgi:coproporphyrinogen III oxidase
MWFGGGGDLNPMFENEKDTADFHAAFEKACSELDRVTNASGASEPSAHEVARSVGQQTNTEQSKYYTAFTQWCDEYFFIPHRNVARGVGGIFYDYLGLNKFGTDTTPVTSGHFGKGGVTAEKTFAGMQLAANANLTWEEGFAFTQNVGKAFATIYPEIIRRHMFESWTDEQRHHQLVKRGRYAEYNLLYDRGTRFGLMTGGNAEAILMSLPPVAIWE